VLNTEAEAAAEEAQVATLVPKAVLQYSPQAVAVAEATQLAVRSVVLVVYGEHIQTAAVVPLEVAVLVASVQTMPLDVVTAAAEALV
tara:strand:- start:102 stop:362 length:261 start_codon:yes stop_codon:yes gene_type:complete